MLTRCVIGLSIAATLAIPAVVAAQDFTPISDRILSDPTYLPLKGEFYGESSYSHVEANSQDFDYTGANTATGHRTLNTLRQTFAFGITDMLSVHIGEGYGFSGRDRSTTASGVTTTDVSGWQDPTFGLTYRVLDQRTNPASLDVFADYSPDAFSSNTGGPGLNRSVARGGPSAGFGLALGHETRVFTIRGAVTATYYGSSATNNSITAGTVGATSYWVPTLGIQTQTRFTNRLSANVGAEYNFEGSPVVTNNVSGLQHVDKIGDNQSINASLNYHFIPNKLVGSFTYGHTFYDHTNNTYPVDPTFDTYRSQSSDTFGVAFKYVFK